MPDSPDASMGGLVADAVPTLPSAPQIPTPLLIPTLPTVPTLPATQRPGLAASPAEMRTSSVPLLDGGNQGPAGTACPAPAAPTTAAAAYFASLQAARAPARTPPKRRRRTGRMVLSGVVLVGLGVGAYLGRDSALAQQLKGVGYDTGALPMRVYPRPEFARAEVINSDFSVSDVNGVTESVETRSAIALDTTNGTAEEEAQLVFSAVNDGVVGAVTTTQPLNSVVVDSDFVYVRPPSGSDPWTRRARRAGTLLQFDADTVLMYQDVVDSSLRLQQPESVVTERLGGVDVTTYSFEFAFGELFEAAPTLYESVKILDGNAAPASPVTITMSVDAEGVVWLLDISLELQDVLDHAVSRADGQRYPYRFHYELEDFSDEASTIVVPTNIVDAPTGEASGGGAP